MACIYRRNILVASRPINVFLVGARYGFVRLLRILVSFFYSACV